MISPDREVHVLVVADVADHHVEQIRAVDPRVRVERTTDRGRLLDVAADVDVLVGWLVPREALQRAGRLRWIHSTAAGVDQLLHPEIGERGIVLTDSSGIHVEPVSDHVVALILAFARRLPQAIRNQLARRWDRTGTIGEPLSGKTVGILGVGHIGRGIRERVRPFGLRVVGTRRTGGPVPGVDRVYGPDGLDEVLRQSDFLVVVLPLTPRTRGLIGARELALMKPDAVLINVGRGAIVQEAPLVEALRAGRLAGAGLDVFAQEPLPQDSPLWELPQVILTPHVSGASPAYYDRAVPLFIENLRRYLKGEPLLNVVDPALGY